MAVWAVGDVQGCSKPLDALLGAIEFDPARDRLWFCGDLVNRGPDSLGVLKRVRRLDESAVIVLGNHDLHWMAQHADDADHEVQACIDWLRRQPLAHYDPDLDCLMVHAGVVPEWDLQQTLNCAGEVEQVLRGDDCEAFLSDMYGNLPHRWAEELSGIERLRMIVNVLTRMRMVDQQGRLDFAYKGPPGKQPPYLAPWFCRPLRLPERCRIVFGHWSALGHFVSDRLVALDSGCVWGGSLAAARLDGPPQSVRVPCPQAATATAGKRRS